VVTHPDAADLEKGRAAAAAAGAAAPPKTGPDPSRAFAKDSNSRTSSSGLCVFLSLPASFSLSPFHSFHVQTCTPCIHTHTHTFSTCAVVTELVDHVAHTQTYTHTHSTFAVLCEFVGRVFQDRMETVAGLHR
jgi:hypothetical protein